MATEKAKRDFGGRNSLNPIALKSFNYNPGDGSVVSAERNVGQLKFTVHKFNNRPVPDKSRVLILCAFSEFGSETLIPLYALPRLLSKQFQGYYSIVMGWYGRAYMYKHLVDEFWELSEDNQGLREYCRAFHHASRNLKLVEKQASEFGKVVKASELATIFLTDRILECPTARGEVKCKGRVSQFQDFQQCQKCGIRFAPVGVFFDVDNARKNAKWIPLPSLDKIQKAKESLPENAVGIVARGRKCYGRNLPPEFYERLIWMVEDMGYNPVWLGEKVSTIACPCPRITDFSRNMDTRDLEQTLAYVLNMKFTIQFWTASTRLSGFMGTPFIIFESPDQIWGPGQEGFRLHLTTKGKKKLVVAHYRSVIENLTKGVDLVKTAIHEINNEDYSTIMGLVEDESTVRSLIRSKQNLITWF